MFCHNPKNHILLIKLGIVEEFLNELENANSSVIIPCISVLADLTNVQDNHDILRSSNCKNILFYFIYKSY